MKEKLYINKWIYKNQIIEETDLQKYYGFVYIITDTQTNKKYIGRKYLWSLRKINGQTRRKRQPSDWKSYYSSHLDLKTLAKNDPLRFKREILHLCKTKGETNFKETDEIFKHDALWKEDFLNENILGRYFRKNVVKYFD